MEQLIYEKRKKLKQLIRKSILENEKIYKLCRTEHEFNQYHRMEKLLNDSLVIAANLNNEIKIDIGINLYEQTFKDLKNIIKKIRLGDKNWCGGKNE